MATHETKLANTTTMLIIMRRTPIVSFRSETAPVVDPIDSSCSPFVIWATTSTAARYCKTVENKEIWATERYGG